MMKNPNSEERRNCHGTDRKWRTCDWKCWSPALEDSDNIYAKPIQVDPSKDHVHTWEENHDQNLATVHPDVMLLDSLPSRLCYTVSKTVLRTRACSEDCPVTITSGCTVAKFWSCSLPMCVRGPCWDLPE